MRHAPIALLATLLLAPAMAAAQAPEPFAKDLDVPVDLAFGADGTLYYAELRTGHVRSLGPDAAPSEPLATVDSSEGGNGGFIGLATDPEEPRVLYAYYSANSTSASTGKINRVVRLDLEAGTETVLLDDLKWTEFHDGGRLAVGADGYLYVTTGDNGRADLKAGEGGDDYPAQDPADLRGKVLRIDRRTGAGAPDNPGGEWNPLVYARGFRNPFGIHALPDGRVFVSENGPESGDEVNLVERGANYGWAHCAGPCDREGTTDPIASWSPAFGPTGLAVKDDVVYVGDFNGGQIRTVDLATGETGVFWESGSGPVLDVELAPDGCLYASTFSGIWRFADEGATCTLPDPSSPEGSDVTPTPVTDDTQPTTPASPTPSGTTPTSPSSLTPEVPTESLALDPSETPAPGALAVIVGLLGVALLRRRCA